jgi:uncharacterized membrane protein YdjX (TVP38/TMEM64 family)
MDFMTASTMVMVVMVVDGVLIFMISVEEDVMRTSPPTIHPHLHQYLLRQYLLVLLHTLVLIGLPIK